MDTALNSYVASALLCLLYELHCFYGIGVSLSPYILSMVIDSPAGWRGGYRIAFGIQLSIALLLFCTLPLWKKAHGREEADTGQAATVLSLREIARIPGVKEMWCLFITSCGIEYTCGNWGSTFLVEARQMTADQAAGVVVFYYVGMALGRLISGLLASRFHSWKIIRMGQLGLGAALIVLLLPGSPYASAAGLFLVGLGNGPLFPNFNYLTPENFGAKVSQSVMGTQMVCLLCGDHAGSGTVRRSGTVGRRKDFPGLSSGILCGNAGDDGKSEKSTVKQETILPTSVCSPNDTPAADIPSAWSWTGFRFGRRSVRLFSERPVF
ncbi:MAG: MFS transporter [Lachnospiraceae bacterium]